MNKKAFKLSAQTLTAISPVLRKELSTITEQINTLTSRKEELEGLLQEPSSIAKTLAPSIPKETKRKKTTKTNTRKGLSDDLLTIISKADRPLDIHIITSRYFELKGIRPLKRLVKKAAASISSVLLQMTKDTWGNKKTKGAKLERITNDEGKFVYLLKDAK